MTSQQLAAINNPCELAEQCANQRYRTFTINGTLAVSCMLTVNVGEE